MNFVQGEKIAVCSKSDMVQLLLNHPNMKTLRAEAGVSLVKCQTETEYLRPADST